MIPVALEVVRVEQHSIDREVRRFKTIDCPIAHATQTQSRRATDDQSYEHDRCRVFAFDLLHGRNSIQ